MGLSGAKRLVNEFDIESGVGAGTRVTSTRWK
jgi:serine/threonine-protein kinase RsbT